MMKRKKGQVVFEFIIAALILFALIFYSINYVSRDFDSRHARFSTDALESRVLRVSEYILSSGNGIIGEWPYLSSGMMATLDNDCSSDYELFLESINLRQTFPYEKYTHINIMVITTESDAVLLSCGRTPPDRGGSATVTRYVLDPGSGEIARVDITIWE